MTKNNSKIIFVAESFDHMGNHSGPNTLIKYLPFIFKDYMVWWLKKSNSKNITIKRILDKITGKLELVNLFGNTSETRVRLWKKAIQLLKKNPNIIFVFLEGEDQYTKFFKQLDLSVKKRMYFMLHQPMAWYKTRGYDPLLYKDFGGLLVFGDNEERYFKNNGPLKVQRTVHGVDLTFFKADKTIKRNKLHLLFVGGWLRDFKLLLESFQIVNTYLNEVQLDCVVPLKYRNNDFIYRLSQKNNVSFYHGISDQELLILYQTSTLVLLPLVDVTANNVMGESIACQTPILCNDSVVGTWYKENIWEGVFFSKNDSKSFADMIIEILTKVVPNKNLAKPDLEKISWKVAGNDIKRMING